jgi:hypothetical protein
MQQLRRSIIEKYGNEFLSPSDKAEKDKRELGYRLGVFSMLASFPTSFYFSRKITADKANASRYLRQNIMMSTAVSGFFAYTL